jgi:N,N'-diacetylchitobiose transport system substrate-binding protein
VKRRRSAAFAVMTVATMVAGLAACGSSSGSSSNAKKDPKDRTDTLTVWLMVDAQTSWPDLVKDVTAQFKTKYPKVNLKIQYQQWANKVEKLDAALSGKGAPDVVELGNTETMTYILNGALDEIDPAKYDNSDTWIKGLKDTCSLNGKLYCVPYYAGARVGVYNSDMLSKAGVAKPPATEAELTDALDKVAGKYGSDKSFSPFYMPGRYWYAAMSYVYAYGGSIATESGGKWTAALSSAKSQEGLKHWADLANKYSHGDKTKDESDQDAVMSKEKSAVMYANGWEAGVVSDPKAGNPKLKDKVKTFAFPGPEGKPLPSFIGGSDLAITQRSDEKDLAADWISMFTSEKSEGVLASKATLPNNTKQLAPLKTQEATSAAANAVEDSWFTPLAPGWAEIEKKGILQTMLVDIVTGKQSVAAAAKSADNQIDDIINTG